MEESERSGFTSSSSLMDLFDSNTLAALNFAYS